MNSIKIRLYSLEIILVMFLFFALFASNIISRHIVSIFFIAYTFLVYKLLKKRSSKSMYTKQVNIVLILSGLLYIGVFYLLGIVYGFLKSKYIFSLETVWNFIIPISIIVITSELIRVKLLDQKIHVLVFGRKFNLSLVITYIAMTLVDLVIYTGVYDLTNLDNFLVALGFVLFASMSCNLLYNYLSIRFGCKGIIGFRLITILLQYLIPVTPDVYLFFRTFLRMLSPYLIYLVVDGVFTRKKVDKGYVSLKTNKIATVLTIVVISLLVALVSCKFTYGIMVIGSKSMTGTINLGDAIVYKTAKDERLNVGDVIVFDSDGMKTVHRITEVRKYNGEYRYYTKGDANKKADDDFVVNDSVIGVVKFRIKYLGYPTIWVNKLFSGVEEK